MNKSAIEQAIRSYQDPWLKTNWLEAKALKQITIQNNTVHVEVVLGYPCERVQQELIAGVSEAILAVKDVEQVTVKLDWKIKSHQVQPGLRGFDQVKNIIAVASGKGGVGKSTTAVNLALALHAEGARVGIIDADIYGPNQPQMLGIDEHPEVTEQKKFIPLEKYGVQSMSIGYLVDTHQAMIWRGPMASKALQQLMTDTLWNQLDYLIVDLPPGTGDIQLTLAQKIPVSGAVIVTTPQEVALLDARKAFEMFKKVQVPVLGLIENMSLHRCSQCGHEEAIFGEGGGVRMAKDIEIDLLGQLPLNMSIRSHADNGCPTVVAEPESDITKKYKEIALKLAARLSLQAENRAMKFPKIVVETRDR